ncbi:hypothetical protein ACIA2T_04655 [Amycolatopsis japonica]|uniref:hypothetical protein n=1 Tax=Amycolatopsis japonica TaxID=208439 RepID=UPI00379E05ED
MSEVELVRISDLTNDVLSVLFKQVDAVEQRLKGDTSVMAGSSLRSDDEAVTPHRLSSTARQALGSSVLHFVALRALVEGKVMPGPACFTLMRAALENAAIAVWLLAPESRDERIFRLLRLHWADSEDELNGSRELGMVPNTLRQQRKADLRTLGHAAGLSSDQVNCLASGKVSFTSIVRTAGDEAAIPDMSGQRAVRFWMAASGVTHARSWAAEMFLTRRQLSGKGDNEATLPPAIPDEWLAMVASIGAQLLTKGAALFERGRQL